MKIYKILLLFLIISSFFLSAHSSQQILLEKLFDKLEKVDNFKKAELLEKKIWSIWHKHHSDNGLTEKLKFGTELMEHGSYDYALKVFDNVIAADPKWCEAWNKRATVYFLMKKYKKSLDDIDKVLKIESRHFGALSGQARIFIKLQEYEKAILSLEKALKFYPLFRSGNLIPEIEKLIKEESV
jgi:tetratricopeptide (TPR) repeat protein